ncbi:hypothetical protein ACPXB3_18155 [Gordonia sp. DT219]|uniref:hypothetical protein n=1 Tax=Gordonia sp. DT219 TaxID=3416658 RepID=UPI003CFAE461
MNERPSPGSRVVRGYGADFIIDEQSIKKVNRAMQKVLFGQGAEIPLRSVVGCKFKEATRTINGSVQVLAAGVSPANAQASDPYTVIFTHRRRVEFERLCEWLNHVASVNCTLDVDDTHSFVEEGQELELIRADSRDIESIVPISAMPDTSQLARVPIREDVEEIAHDNGEVKSEEPDALAESGEVDGEAEEPVLAPEQPNSDQSLGGPESAARNSIDDLADSARAAVATADIVDQILESELFATQFVVYGRTLKRSSIASLLRSAIANNGRVLASTMADIFDVKPTKARALAAWVAQIFNIDGVVVISSEGEDVFVAVRLLSEQFGVME